MRMPSIELSKLEAALYRETSVVNEQDVPRLMLVLCDEADTGGPEGADWLDGFRRELRAQARGGDD